jgi:hypothetical protein
VRNENTPNADHAPDPTNDRAWAEGRVRSEHDSAGLGTVTADTVGRFDGVPPIADSGS